MQSFCPQKCFSFREYNNPCKETITYFKTKKYNSQCIERNNYQKHFKEVHCYKEILIKELHLLISNISFL